MPRPRPADIRRCIDHCRPVYRGVDGDRIDELLDACESYVLDQTMLLRILSNGGDPAFLCHAAWAQLDQLSAAVNSARAARPRPRFEPGE
jgi:hypothetical protein